VKKLKVSKFSLILIEDYSVMLKFRDDNIYFAEKRRREKEK